MTLRLCIIGNSHVACLVPAWKLLRHRHEHLQLTFFAATGRRIGELEAKHGTLVAATEELREQLRFTSGGLSCIDPAEYDLVFLFGLHFQLRSLDARLSQAVVRQCAKGIYSLSLSKEMATLVRSVCDLPIYVGHVPLQAAGEHCATTDNIIDYPQMLHEIAAETNIEGIRFVRQPEATIDCGWFTKPQYAKGSLRLEVSTSRTAKPHPDGESMHMNADYGKLYLEHLFEMIEADEA